MSIIDEEIAQLSDRYVEAAEERIILLKHAVSKRIHAVLEDQDEYENIGTVSVCSADGDEGELAIHKLQVGPLANAVYAILELQNQPIRFQVDSGASCNVLRFEDMQSLNKKVALTSTERSLRMYDGSVTKPLGMCVLSVKNPRTSVKRELEFMIMRQAPVSLLGCAASQINGLTEYSHRKHTAQSRGYKCNDAKHE